MPLHSSVGFAVANELLANEMKTVLRGAGDSELALVFAFDVETSPEDWAGGQTPHGEQLLQFLTEGLPGLVADSDLHMSDSGKGQKNWPAESSQGCPTYVLES